MKPVLVLCCAALVSAGVSAVTTLVLSPAPAAAAPAALDAPLDAGLGARIAQLEERTAELLRRLENVGATELAPASARTPVGEIERVVARLLAERAAEESAAAPASAAPDLDRAVAERDTDELVAALLDEGLSEQARTALWSELAKAGRLDEVVAAFEARAERLAGDPDAQVDLGTAYLQKIFEAGAGPAAGLWAMKADAAFDGALALDERHWEARFSKAVSLAHWPAVFGKQPAAIEHFEILAAQQEALPAAPEHAQTYLLLGNVYQQVGKPDQAIAAWERGLARHPGHAALAEQLELAR